MMYFSASVLGSISLLFFNPNGGVEGRSTVVRRARDLSPDDHDGNCHGDPVCDECSCDEDGMVTCDNPFADLAIYECHEGEVEGIGCHCDGDTIHCDGMEAVHSEDEEDSHSSHEGDEDSHSSHDDDCHCDGDMAHCKDEADEADFDCSGEDHHDHDKEGIDEANYYCLAGDIHGMPKDCMIDTEYLHKDDPKKDCMNWVPKNPTKNCKDNKIKKKCAGICNSLRCQNTKGTEYCRDYSGKLKFKVKVDGKKKKETMRMKCPEIKEEGLCNNKYKHQTKLSSMCPVQCNACLMMEM
mmetsp:Transcript_105/g.123  ORF Transcript_105/g.123 Transcript_105/m.123 type:complete len:296 (+) Transcript_105:375-1262(+)|eukprot:CAMPEP_0170793108 /NCGR_PEP_ID=MMETSP0733-20121128/22415_1 /TAXON_ID=186038 /ORGANISM="Fragilariopsis kerguelensis, Strain L26-C5" /LENGTH=295 /DNA_ID=CAMNT_0011141909 /DNA_START=61 /DNA_END=948 /DNA_ORIENTATION=+